MGKKKKKQKKRKGSNPAGPVIHQREYVNASPPDLSPVAIAGYVEGAPEEVMVNTDYNHDK